MTTEISREFFDFYAWRDAVRQRGLSVATDPKGDNGRPVAWAYEMKHGKPFVRGKIRTIGIDGKSGVQGWVTDHA